MKPAGTEPARGTRGATSVEPGSARRAGMFLLVLLSTWSVGYGLRDTILPGLGYTLAFQGVAPDVAFAAAGLLLVARGLSAERAWALIGAGALSWAAGDTYWTLQLSNLSSPPVPSWADLGYLLFCPLTFAGILALVRGRANGAPRTLVADALAAALAAGSLSAAVAVQPVLARAAGGTLAIATNLAYPVSDLLLLGLIIGATALGNWRLNHTWLLLAASVVVFWVADSFYLVADANGTYQLHAWFNPLWYWSPVLAGWAAWLPRTQSARGQDAAAGTRGIVLPLGFALGALAVLVGSSFHRMGVPAVVLATGSLLVIIGRLALTWRENSRLLSASRQEAVTDALTGLGNRRALIADLERRLLTRAGAPFTLVTFDLDGFKHYNDSYGHPAGDALLQRLGRKLNSQLRGTDRAYRMGGDEFCALLDGAEPDVEAAAAALTEHGEGFQIGCSYGSVLLPDDADRADTALRIADQRMYTRKRSGLTSASRQSKAVLLRVLAERSPDLDTHLHDVARLASAVAARFGLSAEEIDEIRHAAELHDVGKVGIPETILEKRAALDDTEWAFVRRHTLIGERIIAAAPDLVGVAALVRASHENFDGTGYPDALAGDEIPLGARIIAACDAFDAMTTDRPYRRAMDEAAATAELRRCAGQQFDPVVVDRLCEELAAQPLTAPRAA